MKTETQMSEPQETQPKPEPVLYAFPLMPTQELWDRGLTIECGMTLRDYFAARALQMIVINDMSGRPENFRDHYAKGAYEWADAMLRARTEEENENDELKHRRE